ncbi:MAG: serine/threonine protein kinase [Planctomycetia bacterium]|nr:serine/threonine protein kinase [Planctomycetia bacterium]
MSDFRIGAFQVLGKLGQGAHSNILHIRRSADARQYALKVVPLDKKEDLKYLDQAKHEFRVSQLLDHPNLLKVYGLETETDWLFRPKKAHLLLEYVNGKTLDTAPNLTLPLLVQIFVRVSAGLTHMHKKGVLHADLKPNNIMLSKTGQVKIIDYGLAGIKGQPRSRIQGTPEYMAPETAKTKQVTEQSDIYNFGAAMYRMFTGKLPPAAINEGDSLPIDAKTFERLLEPVVKANPKVPKKLAEIIHHCLMFDAARRPERISVIQGQLDHLADELVKKPEDKLESMEWTAAEE